MNLLSLTFQNSWQLSTCPGQLAWASLTSLLASLEGIPLFPAPAPAPRPQVLLSQPGSCGCHQASCRPFEMLSGSMSLSGSLVPESKRRLWLLAPHGFNKAAEKPHRLSEISRLPMSQAGMAGEIPMACRVLVPSLPVFPYCRAVHLSFGKSVAAY